MREAAEMALCLHWVSSTIAGWQQGRCCLCRRRRQARQPHRIEYTQEMGAIGAAGFAAARGRRCGSRDPVAVLPARHCARGLGRMLKLEPGASRAACGRESSSLPIPVCKMPVQAGSPALALDLALVLDLDPDYDLYEIHLA